MMRSIVLYLALFSGIMPAACFAFRKICNPSYKHIILLKPFLLLLAFATLYELLISFILNIGSAYWFRVYDLLEFTALFYFFYALLGTSYKRFLMGVGLLYLGVYVTLLASWGYIFHLLGDGIISSLTTIFVFVAIILWFKRIFTALEVPVLWKYPMFYVMIALLFYYTGTFFLFLLSNYIFKDKNLSLQNFWFLNVVATLFRNVLLTIAVWRAQMK